MQGTHAFRSSIQRVISGGQLTWPTLIARSGLTVDNQGNIYVSDPALNQIQVFRHEGQPFYTFDPSTIKGANFAIRRALWVDAGSLPLRGGL